MKWVRFNAITGQILETIRVVGDELTRDINGFDELKIDVALYTMSEARKDAWTQFFNPWKYGIAKVSDDETQVEHAGIIVKRGFDGESEMITITAYNIMDYFKKVRYPAIFTNVTAESDITVSGATWGEVYAEIIRGGLKTPAPAGIQWIENLSLIGKTGSTRTFTIKNTEQTTVYDAIVNLRDSDQTNGEEIRFEPTIVGDNIIWMMMVGSATEPHIHATPDPIKVSSSGPTVGHNWKLASYSFDDDATLIYNRIVINGSTDEEAPFVGVGLKTDTGYPTLSEIFDSGTDLNSTQMNDQIQARLKGAISTDKDIRVRIVGDTAGFWRNRVGARINVLPGPKTAGAGVTGRVVDVRWNSIDESEVELSIGQIADRYPRLPKQKDKDDYTGKKDGSSGGFSSNEKPDLSFGGDGNDWENGGGLGGSVSISGTVFDRYGNGFTGVIVEAFEDAAFTTLKGSAIADAVGHYSIDLASGEYYLRARVGAITEAHPQNPISLGEESIEEVDFTLNSENILKLYKVTGQMIASDGVTPVEFGSFMLQSQSVGHKISTTSGSDVYIVDGLKTDENGFFEIWLPSGDYTLRTSTNPPAMLTNFFVMGKDEELGLIYWGARVVNVNVFTNGKRTQLGTVELFDSPTMAIPLNTARTKPPGVNNGSTVLPVPLFYEGPFYIRATAGDGSVGYAYLRTVDSGDVEIHTTLVPQQRVTGRMMENGSTPAALQGFQIGSQDGANTWDSGLFAITTDEEGRFTFWVPEGFYQIKTGNSTAFQVYKNFSVASANVLLGDVRTDIPNINVEVTVNGFHIEGAKVEVFEDAGMLTKIDEIIVPGVGRGGLTGKIVLPPGMTTGNIYLRATWNSEFTLSEWDVASSGNPVMEMTAPTAIISGKIVDENGNPWAGENVSIVSGSQHSSMFQGAGRTYAVSNAAGEYSFVVPANSYWTVGAYYTESKQVYTDGNQSNVNIIKHSTTTYTELFINTMAGNGGVLGGKVTLYADPFFTEEINSYQIGSRGSHARQTGFVSDAFSTLVVVRPGPGRFTYVKHEWDGHNQYAVWDNMNTTWGFNLHVIEEGLISGTVNTSSGPVANDTVMLTSGTFRGTWSNTTTDTATKANTTITDSQGRWSFGVPYGYWSVRNRRAEDRQFLVNEDNLTHHFDMLNWSTSNDRGVVAINVRTAGIPVSMATFEFYSDELYEDLIRSYEMLTNSGMNQSSFSIWTNFNRNLYPRIYVKIIAGAVEYYFSGEIANNSTGLRRNIDLAQVWEVKGRVVDENDTPVAGAEVSFTGTSISTPELAKTTTNAEGRYSIYAPKGTWAFRAKRPGVETDRRKTFVIDVTGDNELNWKLEPNGASLGGNIRLNSLISPTNWEGVVQVSTASDFSAIVSEQAIEGDQSGTVFHMFDLPAGVPLYVRTKYAGLDYVYPSNPVTLTSGSMGYVYIDITRTSYNVTGQYIDGTTEAGISGVTIEAYNNSSLQGTPVTATTDANGQYVLSLPRGTYYLRSYRSGYGYLSASEPVVVENANVSVPIIKETSSLVGGVKVAVTVTIGGIPVKGAKIEVLGAEDALRYSTTSNAWYQVDNAVIHTDRAIKKVRIVSPDDATSVTYNVAPIFDISLTAELPM